jgi:GGDEF domain-containing protein
MFSHDGLRDSLTRLAAPPRFYEDLCRELSRSARSGDSVSLIRFVLTIADDIPAPHIGNVRSLHEIGILHFSETLIRLSRGEDLCARIGEYEFVILLRGSDSVARSFIERVMKNWLSAGEVTGLDRPSSYPDFSSSHLSSQVGENALDFLNRLDRRPLKALSEW